jgi:hypothetical protein
MKANNMGVALRIALEVYPHIPHHEFGEWMAGRRVDVKLDGVRRRVVGLAEKIWWLSHPQLTILGKLVSLLKEKYPNQPAVWEGGIEEFCVRAKGRNFIL